ncbi:MAG: hypothetical protein H0W36_10235 [Gemmatimonadetes bacterium]|nr:hypothetical protein [Gemmatimonadota bacterium]
MNYVTPPHRDCPMAGKVQTVEGEMPTSGIGFRVQPEGSLLVVCGLCGAPQTGWVLDPPRGIPLPEVGQKIDSYLRARIAERETG